MNSSSHTKPMPREQRTEAYYSVTSSSTMLTYTSNPRNVPTSSLSPFMITHIFDPMHLSISSAPQKTTPTPTSSHQNLKPHTVSHKPSSPNTLPQAHDTLNHNLFGKLQKKRRRVPEGMRWDGLLCAMARRAPGRRSEGRSRSGVAVMELGFALLGFGRTERSFSVRVSVCSHSAY